MRRASRSPCHRCGADDVAQVAQQRRRHAGHLAVGVRVAAALVRAVVACTRSLALGVGCTDTPTEPRSLAHDDNARSPLAAVMKARILKHRCMRCWCGLELRCHRVYVLAVSSRLSCLSRPFVGARCRGGEGPGGAGGLRLGPLPTGGGNDKR